MHKPKLYLVLLAVLAVASFLCWNVYSEDRKPSAIVWEYKLVSSMGDNAGQLSELGAQGWELTSVRTEDEIQGSFRQTRVYYYLKRAQQVRK